MTAADDTDVGGTDEEFIEEVRLRWSEISGEKLTTEDTRKALERTVGILGQFTKPDDQVISRLTPEERGKLFSEIFRPHETRNGANVTISLGIFDDEEPDITEIGRVFTDRLMVYFEENFWRDLTEGQAQEMLDFLSSRRSDPGP